MSQIKITTKNQAKKLPIRPKKWENKKDNHDNDCDHNPDICNAWHLWQMLKLSKYFGN